MFRLFTLIIICFIDCIDANAQEDSDYFIAKTESGQYLVYGTRFLINFSDNACYEFLEDIGLSKGNQFIITHIMDEMENRREVIIFEHETDSVETKIIMNKCTTLIQNGKIICD